MSLVAVLLGQLVEFRSVVLDEGFDAVVGYEADLGDHVAEKSNLGR
jgi:hypothetical protein